MLDRVGLVRVTRRGQQAQFAAVRKRVEGVRLMPPRSATNRFPTERPSPFAVVILKISLTVTPYRRGYRLRASGGDLC